MSVKFFNCKIYISLLFISFITIILLIDSSGLILMGLICVIIHEFGHLFFMLMLGEMPEEIIFQPIGIMIKQNSRICPYYKQLLIAVGGCLFNLLAVIIGIIIYKMTKSELAMLFTASNISIFIFNITTIKGLDGYDILYLGLINFIEKSVCERICKFISIFTVVLLFIFMLYTIITTKGNFTMMLCTAYLVILTVINIRY